MSTADEIRARVKQADEVRIESRADRAATVADVHGRRAALFAQLADLDAELGTSVRAAFEVMTLDELVDFAGVPRADVRGRAPVLAAAVKARSAKTRRRPATKGTAPQVDLAPSEPSA